MTTQTDTFTPQNLTAELVELHLRAAAEPISNDVLTELWRDKTVLLTAALAQAIDRLAQVAPEQAADLTEWWDAQAEDPDLSDFREWAAQAAV